MTIHKDTRAARLARAALGTTALAAALSLPGCIVAIGNESDGTYLDSSPRRVRLTDTERRDLPMVTTVADLPTVRSKYASQIATLTPSTTVDELRRVLPEARFVERKQDTQGTTDAYSVSIQERYRYKGADYGLEARDELWFYFRNNSLVKQGAPHDWP
ncbi:MAG: hypothetical protein U0637_03760 [Phycisphaerales bacterium]